MKNRTKLALVAALLVAGFSLPAAHACGYENPDAMALGILNWAYPKALYVGTAVWQAENAGVLPPRGKTPQAGSIAFLRAAANMSKLGKLVEEAKHGSEMTSFAVVLIPAVMWTRFVPGQDGIAVEPHARGPRADDVVIVTDEKVVRALIDQTLDFAEAEAHGLLRLYGEASTQVALRSMLIAATQSAALSGSDLHGVEQAAARK